MLLRTTQKKSDEKEEEEIPVKTEEPGPLIPKLTSPLTSAEAPEEAAIPPPRVILPPVPESQQRELFKWMLEEKRKVKPSSGAEKNKVNEEKALLKKFIRAESVPNL